MSDLEIGSSVDSVVYVQNADQHGATLQAFPCSALINPYI